MEYLIILSFFAIPVAAFIFLIVSICRFISAKKMIESQPDSISSQEIKARKTAMIVSCIIFCLVAAVVVGFCILIAMSIRYM